MARLWELAALGLALMVAGAVMTIPGVPHEQRLATLAAIVGGFLVMARRRRRSPD